MRTGRPPNPLSHVLARLSVAESGCWEWSGSKAKGGYGRAYYRGRAVMIHRLTFETWWGPVPPGMEIDHLCRNTSCANPLHLEAVTHRENVIRAYRARPTFTKGEHK